MEESGQSVIRVAIAGQGRSGHDIHVACLATMPERYRLVAVADPLPERRHEAEADYGARSYAETGEMLAAGGFDLFVNATPTPWHVPATIQALEAGYHVLCEKPMAPSLAEFDRMTAAARAAGRILAPFQNYRGLPFFREIQRIISSGVLGQLVSVRSRWGGFSRRWDWQTFQCNQGGNLYNTGPHPVDLSLQFFPEDVMPQVFCRMGCYNEFGGDANDFCALTLHAPGQPHVEVFISQYQAYPQGDMMVIDGTRGSLAGNSQALRWKYYDWAQAPRQELWTPWSLDRQYCGETLPWVEEAWSIDDARPFRTGEQCVYDSLYQAISEGAELFVTLPQVRRQIAVLEEAHRQNPLPVTRERWP